MGSHPARSRQLFGEFRAGARFCTGLDKVLEMVPEFRRSSRKKTKASVFFCGKVPEGSEPGSAIETKCATKILLPANRESYSHG